MRDGSSGVVVVLLVVLVVLAVLGGGAFYMQQRSAELARSHASEARAAEAAARLADVEPIRASPTTAGTASGSAEAAMLGARNAELEARNAELESRVAELELELAIEQTERIEREMEWIDFTQTVAELAPGTRKHEFAKELLSDAPGELEAEPEPDPAEVALAERSAEIRTSLRALMHADWVHGLDLVDAGRLSDDGWIGPVVFRLLDDAGRLSGGLVAQRMRLEASRSGHVVTLVLEDGSESHGGQAVPFVSGVRRISLPAVDPEPWVEAVPEIFSDADFTAPHDGRFDPREVRTSLNERLIEDATGEVLRFRHVGGVSDGVLQDVHVAVLDFQGKTTRHLFADRCRITPRDRGVVLTFEDGVTMRGDSRAPFLEGRLRVFLPRADRDVWERARIPGLYVPPAPENDGADGASPLEDPDEEAGGVPGNEREDPAAAGDE